MAGLKNKKYKIKETRFITIDGNVFKLSGREIYDEDGQITGVKCQFCEFEGNPLGANYCGGCGRNITVNNHIWKVYDSTSYSTYSHHSNRVISEVRLKEYERYEKIVKTNNLCIKVGVLILTILAVLVGMVILWFFPYMCGHKTPIYKQGTEEFMGLICMTVLSIGLIALFSHLIKLELKSK